MLGDGDLAAGDDQPVLVERVEALLAQLVAAEALLRLLEDEIAALVEALFDDPLDEFAGLLDVTARVGHPRGFIAHELHGSAEDLLEHVGVPAGARVGRLDDLLAVLEPAFEQRLEPIGLLLREVFEGDGVGRREQRRAAGAPLLGEVDLANDAEQARCEALQLGRRRLPLEEHAQGAEERRGVDADAEQDVDLVEEHDEAGGGLGITSSSMYSAQGCAGWASCALGHHGLTVTPSSRSAASTLPAMCRQNTHFESHPPRVTKSTSTTACPAARSCSATCLRRLDLPIWRGAKT